jgi:hypothetical protein
MTLDAYLAAVVLAFALLVATLVASTSCLDAFLDARRRRRLERGSRAFYDGRWSR